MVAPVVLSRPWFGAEEEAAVTRVLRSGWIMQGPEVEAFEAELAAYLGAPAACAVSSGTAALHLALRALGVGDRPDDEVVTVSHSFIATANAVRLAGAVPVLVDVDDHLNLDVAQVAAALGPRTRAVLVVHQVGMPADLGALLPLCAARQLPVVEDAACAIGSEIDLGRGWERLGRPHGDVACFSFHPRKILTTGEGGAVTARDPAVLARVRSLRQHGVEGGRFARAAWNYRLTDLQAAVGRVQLAKLPVMLATRRRQAARYRALLGALPALRLPDEPPWARSNWQSFVVRCASAALAQACGRALDDAKVAWRGGLTCAHRQPAYGPGGEPWRCAARQAPLAPCGEGCGGGTCHRLARSEAAEDASLILPLFHDLTDAEQERVAEALARAT